VAPGPRRSQVLAAPARFRLPSTTSSHSAPASAKATGSSSGAPRCRKLSNSITSHRIRPKRITLPQWIRRKSKRCRSARTNWPPRWPSRCSWRRNSKPCAAGSPFPPALPDHDFEFDTEQWATLDVDFSYVPRAKSFQLNRRLFDLFLCNGSHGVWNPIRFPSRYPHVCRRLVKRHADQARRRCQPLAILDCVV